MWQQYEMPCCTFTQLWKYSILFFEGKAVCVRPCFVFYGETGVACVACCCLAKHVSLLCVLSADWWREGGEGKDLRGRPGAVHRWNHHRRHEPLGGPEQDQGVRRQPQPHAAEVRPHAPFWIPDRISSLSRHTGPLRVICRQKPTGRSSYGLVKVYSLHV